MSEYIDILRPQVERVIVMLEDAGMTPMDKKLMRQCAATSIEAAEQRQKITRQQRDELLKLLYTFDVEVFPKKRR